MPSLDDFFVRVNPLRRSENDAINYNRTLLGYVDLVSKSALFAYMLLREVAVTINKTTIINLNKYTDISDVIELADANMVSLDMHGEIFSVKINEIFPILANIYDVIPEIKQEVVENLSYTEYMKHAARIYNNYYNRRADQKEIKVAVALLRNFVKKGYNVSDAYTTLDYMAKYKKSGTLASLIFFVEDAIKEKEIRNG